MTVISGRIDGASWPTEEHAGEEEHQSLFAAYDRRLTDQRQLILQPCQTTGVKSQRKQHLEQGGEMMMILNRRDSHGHQLTKAQSGVNWRNTHTHMDRTRLRSHTYNTVTTTWCEAPAQLSSRVPATSTQKFNVAIYFFSDDEELLPMKSEF